MLEQSFFDRDVETVARELLGISVFVDRVGGPIVETEAYDAQDPAAHTFRGPTPRNAAMFGPAGRAYVYRSYGIHWCMNFTCGHGAGVLIRAIKPEKGREIMRARRGAAEKSDDRLLCAGPGRLCQALAVDGGFNSLRLDRPPFELCPTVPSPRIIACPRIGLSVATDTLRRFCQEGSRYLSKPVPALDRIKTALMTEDSGAMSDQLKDETITVDTIFGTLRVVVTREALNALCGDGSGRRDGRELISTNYDTIAQVATMKFEADEAEDNGTVRVSEGDLEL